MFGDAWIVTQQKVQDSPLGVLLDKLFNNRFPNIWRTTLITHEYQSTTIGEPLLSNDRGCFNAVAAGLFACFLEQLTLYLAED